MAAFHFTIFTGISLNLNVFPVSRRLVAILKNANYFFVNLNQLIITFNLSLFVGFYLAFDFFTVFTLWLAAILEICKLGYENDV